MVLADLLQLGLVVEALRTGIGAAGREAAGLGHVDGRGDLALEDDLVVRRVVFGQGDGGDERLGVGVVLVGEDLGGACLFHHLAQVHDGDVVRDVLDHRQVVGDEQIRQVPLFLQLHHQVEDLGLDGHIQCGDRLVAHDEGGIQDQRPGDAHPLAAAAVQLMGIEVESPLRQAHHVHGVPDLLLELLLAPADLVDLQRLGDDIADGHAGVQRGIGVLEDDLHLPAQVLELGRGHLGDVNWFQCQGQFFDSNRYKITTVTGEKSVSTAWPPY